MYIKYMTISILIVLDNLILLGYFLIRNII